MSQINLTELIEELKSLLRPEWLDPIDLHNEYKISINRQKTLRTEKLIPFHKKGNYIRYSREDIDEWIRAGKVVWCLVQYIDIIIS